MTKPKYTVYEQTILDMLEDANGEIVTRKQITDKLLGEGEMAFSNIVDVHMMNLRRKLPATIEITTVRGKGYQIKK